MNQPDLIEHQQRLLREYRRANRGRADEEAEAHELLRREQSAAQATLAQSQQDTAAQLDTAHQARDSALSALNGERLSIRANADPTVASPDADRRVELAASVAGARTAADHIRQSVVALHDLRAARRWRYQLIRRFGFALVLIALAAFTLFKLREQADQIAAVNAAAPSPVRAPTAAGSGASDAASQAATATPTPNRTQRIAECLAPVDDLWGRGDWPRVIDLLTSCRAIDANNQDVKDKLYAAYYNYGQRLIEQGNKQAAAQQFQNALNVNPNGDEARVALQQLTPTPTSPPPTLCTAPHSVVSNGVFNGLWHRYQSELGCARDQDALGADRLILIEQPFERGHMFFFASRDGTIYLVIAKYGTTGSGEAGRGSWQQFASTAWTGKDENFCAAGDALKYRVFDNLNRVWCFESGVRDKLGQPRDVDTYRRYGLNNPFVLAEGFDNGFILRDSDGATTRRAYVFLNNGSYSRDAY